MKLKRLAEQHYYTGEELSLEEKKLLENSKYKNIIETQTKFDKLTESYLDKKPLNSNRGIKRMRATGIDRKAIERLVDFVEEEFNLGIENDSLTKFSDIKLEEVKKYVRQYIDKNIFDDTTTDEINDILSSSDSIYTLLHKLYLCC